VGDHEDEYGIAARDRLAFLLRASELLTESLDYEETLGQVADLAVPRMADWCSVELVDADGVITQVAVAHVDPEKRELAVRLREQYPPDPNAPTGTVNVIRTGRSEVIENITEELIDAALRPGRRSSATFCASSSWSPP
jgi:GAF domain-containing protein